MMSLTKALVAVMSSTMAAGVAGGVVGLAIGTFAPSFVIWLQTSAMPNPPIDAAEFGLGLGIVCGLFFGAAVGSFLVAVIAFRDAWLARAGLTPDSLKAHRQESASAY